jgi:hypothetical protein
MSQELQTVNIVAPGFMGLNTEDSVLSLDSAFATIADNCVIDKYGRLAARKGYELLTTNATQLGSGFIQSIHQFRDSSGNQVIFSTGNNKILSGTTTLTNATPASYTITANNWKMVNFNNHAYFFQRGYEPLVYSNALGAVTKISSHPSYSGTAPQAHEVLAAYGRLWVADTSSNKSTVYWSDLLVGAAWAGGTSGSIDLTQVWPDGYDEVVALAAHNNLLIIFGKHSILVYQGADAPATMQLIDTVSGVGCISRDTVQYIGTDVLFMSPSGLRAFGRTIQEKSLPMNDLSKNIKTDIISIIQRETGVIRSLYSAENAFYLVYFPTSTSVFCFDVKGTLENGAYRVTRWPVDTFKTFERLTSGDVYVGTSLGIGKYSGHKDNLSPIVVKYFSPNLTFGAPSKLKILKKLKPTVVGTGTADVSFKWSYGFGGAFSSFSFSLSDYGANAFYGVSEYGIDNYTAGINYITPNINASGNGTSIVVSMEATVVDYFSLQEFNILTLLGKTV